ncbi:DNA-binding protein [Aliikangiella sp. IMCC44359]|uniref:DNA-binding protein n=1 Tax=Aliikangiella sp. IMCC44359 TaxID=3459125 RepID=UPI00403AA66D
MARSGITKYDVVKARQILISKGLNPSIDAIRVELGNTGSKTTISRYVKEIESEASVQLEDEALLSTGIKDLITKLAAKLHQEARDIVAKSESSHQNILDELKQNNQQLDEKQKSQSIELKETKAKITELQEQLSKAEEQYENLKVAFQTEQGVKQQLEAVISEKGSQIDILKENYQHSRDGLVHYRDSVIEQREREQRQNDQQIQHLQSEIRQLNQTLIVKQTDITQLNKDNSRLVTELHAAQKENHKLEDKLKVFNQIMDTLKSEINQSKFSTDRLQKERDELVEVKSRLNEEKLLLTKNLHDNELLNAKLETELNIQSTMLKKLETKR